MLVWKNASTSIILHQAEKLKMKRNIIIISSSSVIICKRQGFWLELNVFRVIDFNGFVQKKGWNKDREAKDKKMPPYMIEKPVSKSG